MNALMLISINLQACEHKIFVIFKYLCYRYNMNDRDLRTKKQSIVGIKNTIDKTINNSHIKNGPICEPKQPPNISRHFLQFKNK